MNYYPQPAVRTTRCWTVSPEPEVTAESLASRLFNIVIQHIASNEVDFVRVESKDRELRILDIKDGVSSHFASGHGPLKVESPDTREIVDNFISLFKRISNPPFDAGILPQETGAVIGYRNKNILLKLNFSDAPDGDGLVIEVKNDSCVNKHA